jgi:hypothetical protein
MRVCDGGNRRIEILSSQGNYLGSFSLSENLPGLIALTQRGEILLANRTLTTDPSSSWIYYDYHGQILRERGEREGALSVWENNMRHEFAFALDGNDNLYAAAIYSPVIWKYSSTGVPMMKIDFEVPFVVPDVKSFRRPEGVFVKAEAVSRDLDVDTGGRIFLLSLTRLKNVEERKVGWTISAVSRDGRTAISHKMKFDANPEDADLYQILVFDASGKILGSAKLNIYADRIKVFGDNLFIIDRFVGVKIYEYKISIK